MLFGAHLNSVGSFEGSTRLFLFGILLKTFTTIRVFHFGVKQLLDHIVVHAGAPKLIPIINKIIFVVDLLIPREVKQHLLHILLRGSDLEVVTVYEG